MSRPNPEDPSVPYPTDHGPVKVFVYGEPGTFKTRRAMEMPGPKYIIDLEGGACDYQDLASAETGDRYLSTKSVAKVETALSYLESVPGKFGTLIIDPITIVWQQLQQGHIARILDRGYIMRADGKQRVKVEISDPEEVTFELADWNKLKKRYGDILTRVMNLSCHVVLIARGGDKNDQHGKSKGFGFEAEKTTPFVVKQVIESHSNGDIVLKDRTGTFREGGLVPRIDFRAFLANAGDAGQRQQTDTEAAHQDAEVERKAEHHPSWKDGSRIVGAVLNDISRGVGQKITFDQLAEFCEVLGKPRPSTMDEATRSKLLDWLKSDAGRRNLCGYLRIPLDAGATAK